jgi:hypothetical protein
MRIRIPNTAMYLKNALKKLYYQPGGPSRGVAARARDTLPGRTGRARGCTLAQLRLQDLPLVPPHPPPHQRRGIVSQHTPLIFIEQGECL